MFLLPDGSMLVGSRMLKRLKKMDGFVPAAISEDNTVSEPLIADVNFTTSTECGQSEFKRATVEDIISNIEKIRDAH